MLFLSVENIILKVFFKSSLIVNSRKSVISIYRCFQRFVQDSMHLIGIDRKPLNDLKTPQQRVKSSQDSMIVGKRLKSRY